jgi:hypothetical protein
MSEETLPSGPEATALKVGLLESLNSSTAIPGLPIEGESLVSSHPRLTQIVVAVLRGNGVKTSWPLVHNLNTKMLVVFLASNEGGAPKELLVLSALAKVTYSTFNEIVLKFTAPPGAGEVVYIGIIG